MIKRIFGFILLACVILVVILSVKETVIDNPEGILEKLPKEEWSVFTEEKELIFLVKYMGIIPIGKAKIKVDSSTSYNGRDVYKLLAEAETSGFAAIFYKAKARIESYMDKNKFYSLRYKEELILPDDKGPKIKEIIYDQENHIMTRANMKRKILPDTQDPLSAIFYLRIQDFNIEESIVMNTITKEENYEFKTDVTKKQDNLWMLKSKVQRQDRSSYHGVKFYLWLSSDLRRLPLLVKLWTQAGPITMRLIDIR